MAKFIKNRTYKIFIGLVFVCLTMSANLFGQTISGRFVVIQDSDSKYVGKVQIKLQEGSAIVGNAVIRYKFNPNRLSIPENPKKDTDFKIYNFQNGNYVSSVSHPSEEVISINIAKLFGDDITLSTQYMDVAEVTFTVKNPSESNEFQSDIIQFFPPLSSDMWAIGDWVVVQGSSIFEFVNLVSPNNGANNLQTTVTLKWNKIDGASKYNLQVSKNEAFTDLVYNNEIIDTTKQLTLNYDTQYFWRVRYTNSDGTSPFSGKYSFTTKHSFNQIVLVSPGNNATNLQPTVTLKWNKVGEADKYNLQVAKDNAFTNLVYNNSEVTDTTKRLTLDYDTQYFWRVRYISNSGTSSFSNKYSFTTKHSFNQIVLVSPENNATNLQPTVTLKWNKVGEADKYNLQVAKDDAFTNLVYSNSEMTDTTKRLTLNYDTQYFWRVRYISNSGTSSFSSKNSFTTKHSFNQIVLVSPENNVTNIQPTVTLKWNKVCEADKYNLQVAKDEAFTDLFYNNNEVTDTTKRLSLDYNTQYFWRVRYSNSYGTSSFSSKNSFSTMKAVPKVVLLTPTNDSTVVGNSVLLRWQSVIDKDFYQLQVSRDNEFSDIVISKEELQVNEINIADLEVGNDYYWRVRVSRNNVFGEYSDVFKFSTFSDVPKVVLKSPVNDSTILGTSVWLKWKSVSGRDYYQMQLATDDNFTNVVQFLDTLHINEIKVDNLIKGATYFWRVRASKYNVFGEYSNTARFFTAYPDTTKPEPLAPIDSAMDVNTSLTFHWEKIDTAEYYQLEIAEDVNFDDLFYLNEDIPENELSVDGFKKGTRYFWRVRFASSSGYSMYSKVFTFETLSGTPTIPTLVAPLNNSVDLGTELTFSWENEGVADHFKIEIYKDSGIKNLFYAKDSVTNTSITINNFKQGSQYFWRVRSTNKNGNSGYSDLYKFRTRIGEPSILALIEPMNSAIGLDNSITFKWEPIDSAKYYNLQIADNSNFHNVHFEFDNISKNEITVTNLDEGVQYYWRVTSYNQLGSTTVSNTYNFSTHVGLPDLPVALSPVNNAHNIDTEVSFSWEAAVNTEFYHLEIATDKSFNSLVYSEDTLTINSIKLKDIGEGRKYFWRVRALNTYGNSNFTEKNTFTVKVNKPSDLAAEIPEEDFIKLSWKDNSKVEKRFIIERKVKTGDDSEEFIPIDTLYSNETDYEDYSIVNDEVYVYRVYSENNVASSDYSNTTELKYQAGEFNDPNIPDEYKLSQNYPNPFNPSTKINYSLKEASNVGIKIYNILGEVVETLVSDVQNPGNYTLEWDASNYSSGIYIYVMNAESNESEERFQASNKMVLVK